MGSKRRRVLKLESKFSSYASRESSSVHAQPGQSKPFSKHILKERLCDLTLLTQVNVVDLFNNKDVNHCSLLRSYLSRPGSRVLFQFQIDAR